MNSTIDWSAVNLKSGEVRVTGAKISMPNGGIRSVSLFTLVAARKMADLRLIHSLGDKIAVCAQGFGTDIPSSLSIYDPATNEAHDAINNYFGRPFNSINDLAMCVRARLACPARPDTTLPQPPSARVDQDRILA